MKSGIIVTPGTVIHAFSVCSGENVRVMIIRFFLTVSLVVAGSMLFGQVVPSGDCKLTNHHHFLLKSAFTSNASIEIKRTFKCSFLVLTNLAKVVETDGNEAFKCINSTLALRQESSRKSQGIWFTEIVEQSNHVAEISVAGAKKAG
jgi:hypothetical protein